MLWYGLGRPVITLEIGNWSVFILLGWRFVFGIIIKRDGREPRIVRCHHDSGNNKASSLLRLLRSKLSNHHGLAKEADLQGDTLCLRPVTLHVVLPLPSVQDVFPSVEPTAIVNIYIQLARFEQK